MSNHADKRNRSKEENRKRLHDLVTHEHLETVARACHQIQDLMDLKTGLVAGRRKAIEAKAEISRLAKGGHPDVSPHQQRELIDNYRDEIPSRDLVTATHKQIRKQLKSLQASKSAAGPVHPPLVGCHVQSLVRLLVESLVPVSGPKPFGQIGDLQMTDRHFVAAMDQIVRHYAEANFGADLQEAKLLGRLKLDLFALDGDCAWTQPETKSRGMATADRLQTKLDRVKKFHQEVAAKTTEFYPQARVISHAYDTSALTIQSMHQFPVLRQFFDCISETDRDHLRQAVQSIRSEEVAKCHQAYSVKAKSQPIKSDDPVCFKIKAQLELQAVKGIKTRLNDLVTRVKTIHQGLEDFNFLKMFLVLVEKFLVFESEHFDSCAQMVPPVKSLDQEAATGLLNSIGQRKLTKNEIQQVTDYVAHLRSSNRSDRDKQLESIVAKIAKQQLTDTEAANMLVEDKFGNCLLSTCVGLLKDPTKKQQVIEAAVTVAKKDAGFKVSRYWQTRLQPSFSSRIEQARHLFDCCYPCSSCHRIHRLADAGKKTACKSAKFDNARLPISGIETFISQCSNQIIKGCLSAPAIGDNKSSQGLQGAQVVPVCPPHCFPATDSDQPAHYRAIIECLGDPTSDSTAANRWVSLYQCVLQQNIDFDNDAWSDVILPVIEKLVQSPEFNKVFFTLELIKPDRPPFKAKDYSSEEDRQLAFWDILYTFNNDLRGNRRRKLKPGIKPQPPRLSILIMNELRSGKPLESMGESLLRIKKLKDAVGGRLTHCRRLQAMLFTGMLGSVMNRHQTIALADKFLAIQHQLPDFESLLSTSFAKEAKEVLDKNFSQWIALQRIVDKLAAIDAKTFARVISAFEAVKSRLLYPQLAAYYRMTGDHQVVSGVMVKVGFEQTYQPHLNKRLVARAVSDSIEDLLLVTGQADCEAKRELILKQYLLARLIPDITKAGKDLRWTTLLPSSGSIEPKPADDLSLVFDSRPGLFVASLIGEDNIEAKYLATCISMEKAGQSKAAKLLEIAYFMKSYSLTASEKFLDSVFACFFDPLEIGNDSYPYYRWDSRNDLWDMRKDRYAAMIDACFKLFLRLNHFGDFFKHVLVRLALGRKSLVGYVKAILKCVADSDQADSGRKAFAKHLMQDVLGPLVKLEDESQSPRLMIINHYITSAFLDKSSRQPMVVKGKEVDMVRQNNALLKAVFESKAADGSPLASAQLVLVKSLIFDNHFRQVVLTPAFTDDQKLRDFLLPLQVNSSRHPRHKLLEPATFEEGQPKLVAEQIYTMKYLPNASAFDLRYLAKLKRVTDREKGEDLYFSLRSLADAHFCVEVKNDHDTIMEPKDLAAVFQAAVHSTSFKKLEAVLDLLEHQTAGGGRLDILEHPSIIGPQNEKVVDTLAAFWGQLGKTMGLASIAKSGLNHFGIPGHLAITQRLEMQTDHQQITESTIRINTFTEENVEQLAAIFAGNCQPSEIPERSLKTNPKEIRERIEKNLKEKKEQKEDKKAEAKPVKKIQAKVYYMFANIRRSLLHVLDQATGQKDKAVLCRLCNLFADLIAEQSKAGMKVEEGLAPHLLDPLKSMKRRDVIETLASNELSRRIDAIGQGPDLKVGCSVLDPDREEEVLIARIVKELTVKSKDSDPSKRFRIKSTRLCTADLLNLGDKTLTDFMASFLATQGGFLETAWNLTTTVSQLQQLVDSLKAKIDLYSGAQDLKSIVNHVRKTAADVDQTEAGLVNDFFDEAANSATFKLATDIRLSQLLTLALNLACCSKDRSACETLVAYLKSKAGQIKEPLVIACRMFMLNSNSSQGQQSEKAATFQPPKTSIPADSYKLVVAFVQSNLEGQHSNFREDIHKPMADKTVYSYLDLLDLVAAHGKDLASKPEIISSKSFANSDTILKINKAKASKMTEQKTATIMRLSSKLVKTLASQSISSLFKHTGKTVSLWHDLFHMAKRRSPFVKYAALGNFDTFKQVTFALHDENFQPADPLTAAVLVTLQPRVDRPAQALPGQKYEWPDEDDESSGKQVVGTLRLCLEDGSHTDFDPATRVPSEIYDAIVLKHCLEKETRPVVDRLQKDGKVFDYSMLESEGPFADNSSQTPVIELASDNSVYFSTTFGEGFAADAGVNEAFIRQVRVSKDIGRLLNEHSTDLDIADRLNKAINAKAQRGPKQQFDLAVWKATLSEGLNLGF